ncbi:DUF6114 domain-containing protein [Micromonospora sp. NPDC049497]|uniref:DUF6114 domain-containing protein n=1 Tax=Micromonospora sp. NPDC049497 TaxID=3364273 RepID=UPI003793AF0E
MADAKPPRGRFNRYLGPWDALRRWRRSRPFWGGLLTALAGLEIFGTTQMSLSGLTFQLGPTGFLSWLIPAILLACGLLMWITPQQRIFYAVVAVVTAVYSLIGINLGGFLLGAVLGTIGSGLGFAWVPGRQPVGDAPAESGAAGSAPSENTAADDGSDAGGEPDPETSTDDRADGDPAVGPDQDAPASGDTASKGPGAGNRPSRDG